MVNTELTREPGTFAAMAMDMMSAGPSAVLPDSSKLQKIDTPQDMWVIYALQMSNLKQAFINIQYLNSLELKDFCVSLMLAGRPASVPTFTKASLLFSLSPVTTTASFLPSPNTVTSLLNVIKLIFVFGCDLTNSPNW